MQDHSHYENLQVSPTASLEAIRAAYKRLATVYHPDKGNVLPEEAERVMKMLNESYAVLKDPARREQYDDGLRRRAAAKAAAASGPKTAGPAAAARLPSTGRFLMGCLLAIGTLALIAPKLASFTRPPPVGTLVLPTTAQSGVDRQASAEAQAAGKQPAPQAPVLLIYNPVQIPSPVGK